MIGYNNNDMLSLLLRYQGSVLPKAFLRALLGTALTIILSLCRRQLGLHTVEAPGTIHLFSWSLMTSIFGFLLVFRCQLAYSRFWEGATLLEQSQGRWFTCTSSLFAFCSSEHSKLPEVQRFQALLVRLVSLLYSFALQEISMVPEDRFSIIDPTGIDIESLQFLGTCQRRCDVVVSWIQRLIVESMPNGVLPIAPPILSRVFQDLSQGLVDVRSAKKLTAIPFPFPYSQMAVVLMCAFSVGMPVMGACFFSLPVAALTCFSSLATYWGIYFIAVELELPFGDDPNDLPVRAFQESMNESLMALLDARLHIPPRFMDVHGGRIGKCRKTTTCASSNALPARRCYINHSDIMGSRVLYGHAKGHVGPSLGQERSDGRRASHLEVSGNTKLAPESRSPELQTLSELVQAESAFVASQPESRARPRCSCTTRTVETCAPLGLLHSEGAFVADYAEQPWCVQSASAGVGRAAPAKASAVVGAAEKKGLVPGLEPAVVRFEKTAGSRGLRQPEALERLLAALEKHHGQSVMAPAVERCASWLPTAPIAWQSVGKPAAAPQQLDSESIP
mmetsp:Transcript_110961/g.358206  ORF Transcript_110961/g.358206 Transcript_110961/m.358206 type:complete len:563 (+) Transcript_110961:92-1780(+)